MNQPGNRMKPYALRAGEGWTYRFGIDFTVKAGEIQEGSSAAFVEYVTRKGEEPAVHTHSTEDEMFYVLAGAVSFHCGDETFDLEKGGFIFLPHGIEHGYTILSEEPARLLLVTAQVREQPAGGWGGFVSDIELGQGELRSTPQLSEEEVELRKLLHQVHAEIQSTRSVDEKDREFLAHLEGDIHALLEHAGENPVEMQPSLIQRLEKAEDRFEVTHPDLTMVISKLMNFLSNAGV